MRIPLRIAVLALAITASAFSAFSELETTNQASLRSFFADADRMDRPITILSFGDSMADSYRSIAYSLMNRFATRLGIAGYSLINYHNTLMYNLTNGSQSVEVNTLDPFWFCDYLRLPSGGGIWWESESPPGGVVCDSVGLFYVAHPGGGLFSLSVSTNQGPWASKMVLNGYAPTSIGVYTNLPLSLQRYRLRVDGIAGTNIILGPQLLNTKQPGVNVSFAAKGGIYLGMVTNVPLRIREPIFRALAPDLLIWHMKEDGSEATRQGLVECENWWSNSAPNCKVVYIGTPFASIDTNSTATMDQNRLVQSIALSCGRAYVDCMHPSVSYPWMVSMGFMDDATHENLAGNTYLADFVWDDLGFFALRTPRAATVQLSGGMATISYHTVFDLVYEVEGSADGVNWQQVSRSVGTGADVSTNFPASGSRRFFRLNIRPNH